jgi:RNA polymerase sigma factor (sigma-70 family)
VVGRPPTDFDLVERVRRGDTSAFALLARPHEEIAFRTALLITRNAADAEDAAQEGLAKAYRSLARFRRDAPFRPWLLAIVANEARNRRRSAARREALVLQAGAQLRRGDDASLPELEAIAAHDRATVLAAVEALPEEQRLAIACRYFLDLGEAETATVLGVRPGTVKSRLSRALDGLREQL